MSVPRRRFLALCATGTTALSGCQTSILGGNPTRIGCFKLINEHTSPHTLHVLVRWNGDLVHWSTHTLPARMERPIPVQQTWPNKAGHYVVYARLDDRSDWTQVDLTHGDNAGWYGLIAEIDSKIDAKPSGIPEITLWQTSNRNYCGN